MHLLQRACVPLTLTFLITTVAGWLRQREALALAYLQAENRTLREQLGPTRLRFTDAQRRRLARAAKLVDRKVLDGFDTLVTPDTLARWYRQLVANKYDGSGRRGYGRPRKREAVADLVLRIARENGSWGYTRIRGALAELGCNVGRSTIQRVLTEHGIDPAPVRGKQLPWKEFLAAHWGAVAAADFFTVELLRPWGLVRYNVFFAIDLKSRIVSIAGIHAAPFGDWMVQIARQLTDSEDGFLKPHRYLILDRDPVFVADFRKLLRQAGVEPLRLPPRSPNLNAYAERFVRSIKSECLSKVIPLSEKHLRWLVAEYVSHYHEERTHQGIRNRIPRPRPGAQPIVGPIVRRTRIGGLLSHYVRQAA